MYDSETVTYWIDYNSLSCYRNLVLYHDKSNRFTGELDCVYLELRFLWARIVKGQGIRTANTSSRSIPERCLRAT
jgi:hypothetical protein